MFSQNLGHFTQLGQYKKLPKLFLHSTLNTWVTCSVCRGTGQNSIIHGNGQVSLRICPHCQGHKKYFNGVN